MENRWRISGEIKDDFSIKHKLYRRFFAKTVIKACGKRERVCTKQVAQRGGCEKEKSID